MPSLVHSLKTHLYQLYLAALGWLPARLHVAIEFLRVHGRLPDLKAPRTFNEKVAWRKLYERDRRLPAFVDKILCKEFVAQRYGGKFVIPTLAVYDRPEDMDFGKPPLSQPPYVIKANHGWAMNHFILDGVSLQSGRGVQEIRRRLRGWLATDHARRVREWAYSGVRRRILVEPYMGQMDDFKFHVFHGRVFACEIIANRFQAHRQEALFDRDWTAIHASCNSNHYPLFGGELPPQSVRDRMTEFAESIGREFSYVRVDLYVLADGIRFGELTFYPGGGYDRFHPPAWDRIFGDQWRIQEADAGSPGRP